MASAPAFDLQIGLNGGFDPIRTMEEHCVANKGDQESFSAMFHRLRQVLRKYEKRASLDLDAETEYFLNSGKNDKRGREIFFAGTGINKQTVSFYLAPVHLSPAIAAKITPALRRYLSGKCCFRFTSLLPEQLKELDELTKQGWAFLRDEA